ncbi:MAG: hypothetical protein OXH77_03430 [Anaerolineaceae bacterium]|nr:hypothetical protein [Anaerolineaceae bacterium]
MLKIVPARALSLVTLLAVLVSGIYLANFLSGRVVAQDDWLARRSAITFADRLRQTSDDLTRMVRLYAVNGDPVYREYFDEILAIRNGDAPRPVDYFSVPYWDIVLNTGEHFGEAGEAVPIRTLASEARLLEEELAEIAKAEDASNALAVIENEIMEVVAAQIEAGDGDYVLEGESLYAMLRLHGPDYFATKAEVMTHLVELRRKVDQSFAELRPQVISFYDQGLRNGVILLAVTLVLVVADFLVNRRRLPVAGLVRSFSVLATLLTLVAVLFSLATVANFQRERPTINRYGSARLAARSFADNLRQTSDDLTLMVRLYAINGDPLYRSYFDEILDIRNGIEARPQKYFDVPYWDIVLDSGERTGGAGEAVAIRTRARNAGLTEGEFAEFIRAEDASNALAEIENEIMDVIAAQIDAGGDYVLEGEALQAMLRLHGPEYHAAKAQVMQPLVELERKVEEAYAAWTDEVIAFNDLTLNLGVYALAAAFLLTLAGIWLRRR